MKINNKLIRQVYSTNEQRIGTWLDGKPIYRKVVANNVNVVNGSIIFDITTLDIEELVSVNSINKKTDGYTFFNNYYDGTTSKLLFYLYNGKICTWTGGGGTYTSTIWIEYTKTTD